MQERIVLLVVLALVSSAARVQGESIEEPQYLLYTQRTKDNPQPIKAEVESIVRSSFYALDPITISIPRWNGNSSSLEHSKIVAAKLDQQAGNVITVDLSNITSERLILESVTELVIILNRHFEVPLKQVLLVGFAEGANVAAGVGEKVQKELGQQLPHIIGLEPTFAGQLLLHPLSTQAAKFVEVIHTNTGGLGTLEPLGHVDYYPNGGDNQPGCDADICSHERALYLLHEMWSPANDFVSALCSTVDSMSANNCRWSSLRMGEKEKFPSGIYFLETRSSSPYSKGAYYIGFL